MFRFRFCFVSFLFLCKYLIVLMIAYRFFMVVRESISDHSLSDNSQLMIKIKKLIFFIESFTRTHDKQSPMCNNYWLIRDFFFTFSNANQLTFIFSFISSIPSGSDVAEREPLEVSDAIYIETNLNDDDPFINCEDFFCPASPTTVPAFKSRSNSGKYFCDLEITLVTLN